MTNCPNCNAPIKSGMFNANEIINDQKIVKYIHEYTNNTSSAFCNKCEPELVASAKNQAHQIKSQARKIIEDNINSFLIISAQMPVNWTGEAIGVVTSQTVIGTGVFTEISSSFTDLLGGKSNSMRDKIRKAETDCFIDIRQQAFKMGGNAVIALDIDYGEVGGGKGMLMVCMTGTVVTVNNMPDEYSKTIKEMRQALEVIK